MTRYEIFDKIEEFISTYCKMEKTGEHQYNKMIQSGKLVDTLYDYGKGYYDVCIYYRFDGSEHYCRIWFGTIDDGDFGSWTICKSKEEAIDLVEKAKDIFSEMNICPNEEDLNNMFKHLSIHFCNE